MENEYASGSVRNDQVRFRPEVVQRLQRIERLWHAAAEEAAKWDQASMLTTAETERLNSAVFRIAEALGFREHLEAIAEVRREQDRRLRAALDQDRAE